MKLIKAKVAKEEQRKPIMSALDAVRFELRWASEGRK